MLSWVRFDSGQKRFLPTPRGQAQLYTIGFAPTHGPTNTPWSYTLGMAWVSTTIRAQHSQLPVTISGNTVQAPTHDQFD
jgi:hypothetical protein